MDEDTFLNDFASTQRQEQLEQAPPLSKRSSKKIEAKKPKTKSDAKVNKLFEVLADNSNVSDLFDFIRGSVSNEPKRIWLKPLVLREHVDKSSLVTDNSQAVSLLERSQRYGNLPLENIKDEKDFDVSRMLARLT